MKHLVVTSPFWICLVLDLVIGIPQEVNHTIENKSRITQRRGSLSKLAPELDSGNIHRLSINRTGGVVEAQYTWFLHRVIRVPGGP